MGMELRSSVLVTKGNYAIFPGGQKVFECPTTGDTQLFYNVAPGQLVAYNPKTGDSIDATTITAMDVNRIVLGVAVDYDGDGLTDDIRKLGGEEFFPCYWKTLSAEPPKCGAVEISRFFFGCVDCHETLSLQVRIDDNHTRSFGPMHKSYEEFIATVTNDCCSCSDCEEGYDCQKVVCNLVDQLNGDIYKDDYPDWKAKVGVQGDFRAIPLFNQADSRKVFCFDFVDTDCEDCHHLEAVDVVTIGGVEIPLTGTTNPADSTQTLYGQLKRLQNQVRKLLKENSVAGDVYVTRGPGGCCPVTLISSVCDPTFALGTTGSPITPCEEINPFQAWPQNETCLTCPATTPADDNFSCGLEVIGGPLDLPCDPCNITRPLATYFRTVDVNPIGEGWKCGATKVHKVQTIEIPQNFGAMVQYMEYKQDVGGGGRKYRGTNQYRRNGGVIMRPDGTSRASAAISNSDCTTSYCSYHLLHQAPHMEYGFDGTVNPVPYRGSFYVPQKDDVTRASLEEFFQSIIDLVPGCHGLAGVTCDYDQDQNDPSNDPDDVLNTGNPDDNNFEGSIPS